MKKWILYINALLLLVGVSFLFGFSHYKNKPQNLSDIEVIFEGEQPTFLTASIVNKLLIQSEDKLLNKAKSKINLHKIEQLAGRNKMIENIEVSYTPAGKLQARVIQRVPVARINKGSQAYYLDRQGQTMPLSGNYSARVPLITGVTNKKHEEECYELVQILTKDAFFEKQVIGIYRRPNGDYLLNTRIGNHKVLFGKLNRIEEKLEKLKIFYKKEWGSETLKKYRLLNLKYKHQVVCS